MMQRGVIQREGPLPKGNFSSFKIVFCQAHRMQKKGSGKDSLINQPNEATNSPRKEPKKGPEGPRESLALMQMAPHLLLKL